MEEKRCCRLEKRKKGNEMKRKREKKKGKGKKESREEREERNKEKKKRGKMEELKKRRWHGLYSKFDGCGREGLGTGGNDGGRRRVAEKVTSDGGSHI